LDRTIIIIIIISIIYSHFQFLNINVVDSPIV